MQHSWLVLLVASRGLDSHRCYKRKEKESRSGRPSADILEWITSTLTFLQSESAPQPFSLAAISIVILAPKGTFRRQCVDTEFFFSFATYQNTRGYSRRLPIRARHLSQSPLLR